MPTEGSNQTFQSYMTARSGAYSFEEEDYENEVAEHQDQQSENGSIYSQNQEPQLRNAPSFSSINESIFHNSSKNTTLDTTENDETPLIDSSERYPDETPIVDDNGFLHEINHGEKDIIASEPIDSNEPTSLLPKQNLSKKFKRVSVALQNTRTSGESYNFRNVFQNNVDQANRTATQDNTAPNLNAKVHITGNYRRKSYNHHKNNKVQKWRIWKFQMINTRKLVLSAPEHQVHILIPVEETTNKMII